MNSVKIMLVFDPDASNTTAVRKQMRAVLQSLGWMPTWQELAIRDPALPKRYRTAQAPFLLLNGKFAAVDDADEMAHSLKQAQESARKWAWLRAPLASSAALPGILLAFFPKCAGCWAAYASVLGSMGIGLPYMPWMRHVLAASLVLSSIYFARMARRRNRWIPFGFQMTGFTAVLASQYVLEAQSLLWTGVAFVFAGSLLYAMPDRWMEKLTYRLSERV